MPQIKTERANYMKRVQVFNSYINVMLSKLIAYDTVSRY